MDPIFEDESLVAVGDPAVQVTSDLAILMATAMALGKLLRSIIHFIYLTTSY